MRLKALIGLPGNLNAWSPPIKLLLISRLGIHDISLNSIHNLSFYLDTMARVRADLLTC